MFYLFNWIYRYAVGSPPETVAVIAGIIQSFLYADFFYIYYQRYINLSDFCVGFFVGFPLSYLDKGIDFSFK